MEFGVLVRLIGVIYLVLILFHLISNQGRAPNLDDSFKKTNKKTPNKHAQTQTHTHTHTHTHTLSHTHTHTHTHT